MPANFHEKTGAFAEISQLKLTKILDSISGKKDIVIDATVMKPIERFIGVKKLRSHGIDKIYKLDRKDVANENSAVVYLIRGNLITMKIVSDQINASSAREIHIIVIPWAFHSLEILIEEEGLSGRVKLHSFPWELTCLDKGVLSFEAPEIFKFFFVSRDPTFVTPIARSLWSLEQIFGKIPFKMFLGSHSKAISGVMDILDEKRDSDSVGSDIGLLLVVDRDIDYASPLLTASTYTSLVGDVLGINTGVVELSKANTEGKQSSTAMQLSSENETYNHIKHRNFSDVCVYLSHKVNEIKTFRAKSQNMSIKEMKSFVDKELETVANNNKIVANHLNICEQIMKKIGQIFEGLQNCQYEILTGSARKECTTFIEELISYRTDMHLALRLACLLSISQNGLSQYEANSLKTQFLHAYGHRHLATFHALEKMGLFTTMQSGGDSVSNLAGKVFQAVSLPRKSAFKSTAEKLKLFPGIKEDYSIKNPQDPGYVFNGLYIPVIVQIVNLVINKELKTVRDLIKRLPNEGDVLVIGKNLESSLDINPRSILVYVVGGITYAEMAAFSFLEQKTGCRIICAGSSIINGNSLVQSAVQ